MVIKPGKEFIVTSVLIIIANIVMFIVTVDEPEFCVVSSTILFFMSTRALISLGRTLIFDYQGCTVCLGKYKKTYKWNDFRVIRLEEYKSSLGQKVSHNMKGIVFSPKQNYRLSWIMPGENSALIAPFSLIYVYLVNVSEYDKLKKAGPYFTYIAEEQMFLRKLIEWDVIIENMYSVNH